GGAKVEGEAIIVEYSSNKVVIEASANRASMMVLSDVWYPGWKAYVDGVERKIYKVDGVLRGVTVGKGTQSVEFRYRPLSFRLAIIAVLISVLLSVVLLFWEKRGRRGRPA
ncbi:MAG: YfhO family protein, partial [Thermodesulfobacteriota bacterium]